MKSSNSNIDTYRIAIDAMGGDFAPTNEILGAIRAYDYLQKNINIEIIFVGDEKLINEELSKHEHDKLRYSVCHAEEVVLMGDEATIALKKKKNSSIYKGLELHRNGEADCFMSAGNTGATMATATVLLGRIKGASRPTIGSFFPTETELPALVLDVGATLDHQSRFLYEYSVMGSIYYKQMMNVEHPKVALLNVGEEKSKGTEEVKKAYGLLMESDLNFIGNIEGRDIFNGKAHVVVCDGFTGNIILKLAESFFGFFKTKVKQYAEKSLINKVKVALTIPTLRDVSKGLDYQEYGGVPLLGINGVVIIGHGKSSPIAIQNMIFRAVEIIRRDVNKKIEDALV